MASAGRILIMPKGRWAAETEYEMLDLVAHNGRAWIAKKVSVGIEPSDANAEFWHDFLGMDVFTEENPPTAAQVGAVSLYADPVLSKSTDWDNLESGTYRFSTWGGSGGVGYPPIDDVGICILFDTEAGRYMYCLGMNRIVSRYYESKTWSDWIEGYLPLTGGTLKFNGKETAQILPYEHSLYLLSKSTNGSYRGLVTINQNIYQDDSYGAMLEVSDGSSSKQYILFGEHNKPSGSYTGNGSAILRQIATGGIGQALLVRSDQGSALVTSVGAICWSISTVSAITVSEVYLYNDANTDIFGIATANNLLNKSGTKYYWNLL